MPEYAARFAENDIDLSVLVHLTDQDLKELRVSLGHRRKLLAEIAELPGDAVRVRSRSAASGSVRHDDAEPRQLSIMFCDLVGSTTLSTRLDLEDLREVIGSYHRCCAELIGRNSDFVAKYMGDGVLAYILMAADIRMRFARRVSPISFEC
jgi:class 3 adenylate cyclase